MAAAKGSSFRKRLIDHAKGPMGLASIGEELRYALADIRQKVVEEGMYGRATTPPFEEVGIHGKVEPAASDQDIGRGFKDRCKEVFDQRPPDSPADTSQAPEHD